MNVRSSNDVSCYPAPSEVDSNHGNPCLLVGNSLFPKSGNTLGGTPKSDQITEAASPGSPDFNVFPCIFPANQGFAPRDEFATDCTLRHLGPRLRRIRVRSAIQRRISRHSAGFWTSAQAIPDRRPRWCGSSRAPAERFLRGRVGRSGSRRPRRLPHTDWGFASRRGRIRLRQSKPISALCSVPGQRVWVDERAELPRASGRFVGYEATAQIPSRSASSSVQRL